LRKIGFIFLPLSVTDVKVIQ